VIEIGNGQQGLQAPQYAIGPPVLRQFYGGSREISTVLGQFGLKLFKQREGIGRGAGEPRQHRIAVHTTHFPGIVLHDRGADRDLSITAHRHLTASSHT